MANILLVDLEQATTDQINHALAVGHHRIVRQKSQNLGTRDLKQADIIFADGNPAESLRLLRWVRKERPALPFVVVTHIPDTTAWLDALEAGATDFCSPPLEARQIHWLMEYILRKPGQVGAG
jgi:DNA-binding NtrC family response regulator